MAMKYIVVQSKHSPLTIYVFPDFINHADICDQLAVRRKNISSAGFVNKHLKCHGKSVTLGIDSKPEEDTELLQRHLGLIEIE